MTLSERLKAVADLVPKSVCLADIGTDHGYVPICLAEEGRISRALAADVRKGPLQRACANIRQEGLSDRIEIRLSDGLQAVRPGEVDAILIAGMGGPLTIRILKNGKAVLDGRGGGEGHSGDLSDQGDSEEFHWKDNPSGKPVEKKTAGIPCGELSVKALVLQPQSEVPSVRRYLSENGWLIRRENMVLEDGKFYPMMEAERGSETLSDLQCTYGPRLLEERHPVLAAYLRSEERTILGIMEGLQKAENAEGRRKREEELLRQLRLNRNAKKLLG